MSETTKSQKYALVVADETGSESSNWDRFIRGEVPKPIESEKVKQLGTTAWHIPLSTGLPFLTRLLAATSRFEITLHVLWLKKSMDDWTTNIAKTKQT